MNTNTIKLSLISLLVHSMCFTVVLSHMHAKDAASMMSQQSNVKMATSDIPAKALGDLHHHIDKAGLKNVSTDNGSTTAARTRELNPLTAERDDDDSLGARLHDFMLRFRVVASLCYNYAF